MKPHGLFLWMAWSGLALAEPAKEVASNAGANLQRPVWSDDGTKLAYEANFHEAKNVELYTGDPITRRFTKVTLPGRSSSIASGFAKSGGSAVHEIAWSPASMGRFVFAASNADNDYELYLGGGSALAPAPSTDGLPAWSPDGQKIAFSSARTGQGDLYLLDVSHIDTAPKRLTSAADSSELFASWSPDSQKLAYVGRSKTGDNIWLFPSLTASPVQLTNWGRSQLRPTFSPSGAKIAFYADREDAARWDLYMMDASAGATPVVLARDVVPNAIGPVWTADSKHIIAVLDDDDRYDPLVAIPVAEPVKTRTLDFGTVGHGDLDLVQAKDGKRWLAYVAQGKKGDTKRTFDRLYLAELPTL